MKSTGQLVCLVTAIIMTIGILSGIFRGAPVWVSVVIVIAAWLVFLWAMISDRGK